jgi:CHAT domain-containing protein/TolA-binding protein
MSDVPRHPEAQVMAAFVDGTLAPNEIDAVASHLRDCTDCRTVVSETARFEREEESLARPRPNAWWLAAAAAIVAIVIAVPMLRPRTPIDRLIAASPREHRNVEARLSGFPWARLAAPARGDAPPDPADLKLIGAAGDVLEKTTSDRTPEARHAVGVADLFIGRRSDSIAALEQAASASNDLHIWSDLAAARYAYAARDEHLSQLPEALADADHALRIDPKSPEALFNRALIIEALGLREQSRKAWQKYLEIDPGSGWAVEARERLRRLDTHARRFDRRLLEELPPDQLVREFPQEARTWGEAQLLPAWADAEKKHDPLAAEQLSRVRSIGEALSRLNRESMLADAVSRVDQSQGAARVLLADAHCTYRDGRQAYASRDARVAENAFRRAAAQFARGSSPLAEVALYYAASTAFDQNRAAEARAELLLMRSRVDGSRHRALVAQIDQELAVIANTTGDWGDAAYSADAAAAIFRSLGERANTATNEGIAAVAREVMGEKDRAWTLRIHALADLSAERGAAMLRSAALTAGAIGNAQSAVSLIDLVIDGIQEDSPVVIAATRVDSARLAARNDDVYASRRILEARGASAHISDAALRDVIDAQISVADGMVRGTSEPRAAVAAFDRAIEFFRNHQLNRFLPDALLQRARSLHAAGDDHAALADYGTALQEIERQRDSIRNADLRMSFLDTATQIIEETVELQLARGAIGEAFAVADQSRTLRKEVPPTPIGANFAVIEYVLLPRSVAIFCITRNGVTGTSVPIDRRNLIERIEAFGQDIRRRAPVDNIRREGAAIYEVLIGPVRQQISGHEDVVIVPDRQLYAVPFSALYDEQHGQYLVEQFSLGLQPSSGAQGEDSRMSFEPALVIADPQGSGQPALAAARDEAERVASIYGAPVIAGGAATYERFISGASTSALIHYAGHADSDASGPFGALMLAGSDGHSGVLSSADISALSLARQPLVVLAACGTLRGNGLHVAAMPSIARSFLMAGARGVVGTLWEIDDDVSSSLFVRFHQHLRAGASPAHALHAAQLEMLRSADARLQHPATWSAIELLGKV